MLIQGKILSYGDDLTESHEIRREVFVDELKILEKSEFDDMDIMAMHVIVFEETGRKKAVATGRIIFDGAICEIGHIAVRKEYRGKKYGDFTVRMLLNKAFTAGIHEVICTVPCDQTTFFQSIGFRITEEELLENEIIKCKMMINEGDVMTSCRKKDKNN